MADPMSIIDFSHLTMQQRLDLIGELWESIDSDRVPLTKAQSAEIDRRIATLDQDAERARDAGVVLSELKARYRR
jgi:putative addiction module component (TIGR02574 family)